MLQTSLDIVFLQFCFKHILATELEMHCRLICWTNCCKIGKIVILLLFFHLLAKSIKSYFSCTRNNISIADHQQIATECFEFLRERNKPGQIYAYMHICIYASRERFDKRLRHLINFWSVWTSLLTGTNWLGYQMSERMCKWVCDEVLS